VNKRRSTKKHTKLARCRRLTLEALETRRVLAEGAAGLAAISDEFDDAASQANWERIYQTEGWNADHLQVWDVNQTQPGRMVMQPHTVVWYQDRRGPMAFQEVTGDFAITAQVIVTDRDDVGGSDADDIPNDAQYSLAGVMIRTPRDIQDPANDWQPGTQLDDGTNQGENYVFLSLGHGTDGDFSFEVKTTRNSNSQLELTPAPGNVATLQTVRIGDTVVTLMQTPGSDWVVHRRYTRPDMPETMHVGLVSYTNWTKANDFDPFVHNNEVMDGSGFDPTPAEPFNPDIHAGIEYARYALPVVPPELEGVDLLNDATDDQLLSFLGASLNQPAQPPGDLPEVGVAASVDAVGEADGAADAFILSRSGDTTEALEVFFQLAGAAESGVDFSPLPASIVIPAGESSLALSVSPIDDGLLEGPETMSVELIDGLFYELGADAATTSILDDEFPGAGPLATPHATAVEFSLPIGESLSYSAEIIGDLAYQLDQQYQLTTDGSYYENWGGQQERWIRDDTGGWFYLLPTGAAHEWNGDFAASPLLGELTPAHYDDPTLLTDAQLAAEVVVNGVDVAVTPNDGFLGSLQVAVHADNGHAVQTAVVEIDVTNNGPAVDPIADQSISHTQSELLTPFVATDPDGEVLDVSAEVIQPELYQLDEQYEFESDGQYYEDWGGQSERWIRDSFGGWYYLLPTGSLHEWNGDFGSSPELVSLDVEVYQDPQLLTDATPAGVTATIDGDNVVIQHDGSYVGTVEIVVTAADALESASQTFALSITNAAPVIGDMASSIELAPGEQGAVNLIATDVDGDTVEWSVSSSPTLAQSLDDQFDLQPADNFYDNWGGQSERWLQGSGGNWFYILPSGQFYQWAGSFESSQLLAELDAAYYDDPNLIAEPLAAPVTWEIVDGQLMITAAADFVGEVELQLAASDSFANAATTLTVTIQ
jgi:hypothetical protein